MPAYTITEQAPTSRTIEVATAKGPYPVCLTAQSERPVTAIQDGAEVIVGFEKMTWDETCAQAAEQVQAALGAP